MKCASTSRRMTNSAGGSDDGAPRAIVAGHGDFAAGLVSAVTQITGRGECFVVVSNRNRGALEIESALLEAVEQEGARIIFTDLPAGSCTIAARRVLRTRPDIALVTGANLAALLDFVFQSASTPAESAQHAVEKGRAAIQAHGGGG